jgi:hypothetical protein
MNLIITYITYIIFYSIIILFLIKIFPNYRAIFQRILYNIIIYYMITYFAYYILDKYFENSFKNILNEKFNTNKEYVILNT